MRSGSGALFAGLGSAVLALGLAGCGPARADVNSSVGPIGPERTEPVELTVYMDDFAQIRERRKVAGGEGPILVSGLSGEAVSTSFDFVPNDRLEVVSSKFLPMVGEMGLIQRMAGREVELLWPSENGAPKASLKGTLEMLPDGGYLIRSGDRVYLNPKGTFVFPADASTSSALRLQTQGSGSDLEFSYLTRGLDWKSDYTFHLDDRRDTFRMELWATVRNDTSVPYRNATLRLAAGTPNRAALSDKRRRGPGAPAMAEKSKMEFAADSSIPSTAVGELEVFDVPEPVNLEVEESNRVRMMAVKSVPVRRDYSAALPWLGSWEAGRKQDVPVVLALHFTNDARSGLGRPLPSGTARVYSGGTYVGAAGIDNLPTGRSTSLTVSESFGLGVEWRVAGRKRTGKGVAEVSVEVVVRNGKEEEETVRLVQPTYGSRRVVRESAEGRNLTSGSRQWQVVVPPRGETTLTFTLELAG